MTLQEFLRTIRRGEVTAEEIGRGMHKSFKNASGLIEDAEILLDGRPARALSLAVLAIEEIAKVVLLTNAAAGAVSGPLSWNKVQALLDLKSHRKKQAVFAAYGKAILDKLGGADGKSFYEESIPGGIGPLLDFMKQLGFYVDVADGKFVSPDEFGADNRKWAVWLIEVGKERIKSFEKLHGSEEGSVRVAREAGELMALISEVSSEAELKDKIREFIRKKWQEDADKKEGKGKSIKL